MNETIISFGEWVKIRRNLLGFSRKALALQVACSPDTIKKIEGDLRRPSLQIAELLAEHLSIPTQERDKFIRRARGQFVPDLPAPEDLPERGDIAGTPHHNLPAPTTPFIGRETELAALHLLLTDPKSRLVTILGPGGMGKTRLGLEAGRQIVESLARDEGGFFADGVHYVELAPLQAVEHIVPAIAEAIKYIFHASAPPQEQLVQFLRRKRLLLILDNFEHLLEGGEIVRSILAASEGVTIMTTSRAKLNLKGEHLFPIGGMPYPAGTETARVLTYSAVQLFLQNARRVQPGLALDPPDLGAVLRICQLTEGMPLAIQLASAWLEVLSLPEIVAEIEGSFDFLESDLKDVPSRHQSMRAVFDHSWKLMSEKEQRLFAALSVFRGGFTRQAVQEVTGATLRDLLGLVNKSLVQREPGNRYGLHELLRQYGVDKLDNHPEDYNRVRQAHTGFYFAFLEKLWPPVIEENRQDFTDKVAPELDNLRLAWEWAVSHNQIERFNDRNLMTFGQFLEWTYRSIEGEQAFRQLMNMAEEAAKSPAGIQDPLFGIFIRFAERYGLYTAYLGQYSAAQKSLDVGDRLLQQGKERGFDLRQEEARLSYYWSTLPGTANDLTIARSRLQNSARLFREVGDIPMALEAESKLAYLSNDEAGKKILLDLLNNPNATDANRMVILGNLVLLTQRQGDFSESIEFAHRHLSYAKRLNQPHRQGYGLAMLGTSLALVGALDKAKQVMSVAQNRIEEFPMLIQVMILNVMVELYLHMGEMQKAEIFVQKLAESVEEHAYPYGQDITTYARGRLFLHSGQLDRAADALQAIAQPQRLYPAYESLIVLALINHKRGEIQLARQTIRRYVMEVGEGVEKVTARDVAAVVSALPYIAYILKNHGRIALAVEVYAFAMTYPFVANSQWYAKLLGKEMDAAAAALPKEAVAAAQERGQMRDIWETAKELLAVLQNQGGS